MAAATLKGTLVGGGYFAGFQASAWKRMPGVEIVSLVEPMPERAREFAARWGIPRVHSSLDELLHSEKPDFLDIATRPEAHLPLVELAAAHRVPAICQKPMAPSWGECVRMVEICREAQVRLLIHENWRWQAWYREVKRLLDTGIFGGIVHLGFLLRTGDGRGPEPYTVQPYFRDMPRLLVYETLIHFLDTFRFLAGEIGSVFCRTRRINPHIAGEDYAVIQLGFQSGANALIDANRISGETPPPVAFGTFTLEGEYAALRMTTQGDLFITEYGKPERAHPYNPPKQGYKGDSVFAAQRHYSDCLRDGTPCETEAEDYLKSVRAMFACYESAETGRIISLT